jgi:hypothetical protein
VNRVSWVSTEALSPREAALNKLSAVMQAAAALQAAALAGLLAFGLLRPEGAAWASALAGGFGSGAALFVLLGLSANIGAALLLAAALLAQENWTWLLALGAWVANAAALLMWGYWPVAGAARPAELGAGADVARPRRLPREPGDRSRSCAGGCGGARAFAIVSVFVFLMGAFVVLLYVITPLRARPASASSRRAKWVGRSSAA